MDMHEAEGLSAMKSLKQRRKADGIKDIIST
jgi:hypothetical protein